MSSPPLETTKGPTLAQGRYRLVNRLGEGGMAAVYRAWDTRLQRWVAIKVLLPDLARRKKVRKRFENEAAVMARIDHRHVLSVYDVGTDGSLPYMVMELAEGGCIQTWIKRHGPMPPRLAVDVVMQVCKGIGAAHDLQVIHRDIKPHNVLVTHRGVCKVTDFGIAQIADAGDLTRTGSVMGTLGFMAPEQRNDAKSVDHRADIYSIGATLYSLLTRRNAADLFLAEHDAALLEGVPAALSAVLLKATTYHPEDRYEDVAQLARALHTARRELPPIPAGTPSLVMDPEVGADAEVDQPSEPTFPEIEVLLSEDSGITPLGDRPTEITGTPPPRPLPYLMPDRQAPQDAAASDALPDYIDASSLEHGEPARPAAMEIGVPEQDASAGAAPSPEQEEEEAGNEPEERDDGSLDVAENAAELVWSLVMGLLRVVWKPLSAVALPGTILLFLILAVIGYGAMEVRAAADHALTARAEVYASLEQERLVVDELTALGASRQGLEAVFAEVRDGQREPERYDAAMRYVRLLESQLRTVSREPNPALGQKIGSIQQRINRVHLTISAYDEALLAWEEAARGTRGALAVRVGAARAP